MSIAETPEPPYYAAIFTTVQTDDSDGYVDMAKRMFALAAEQPGYLGFEIAGSGQLGIGVSYWTDEDSIRAWKANAEHQVAQETGRSKWYKKYQLRVARVERDYGFPD